MDINIFDDRKNNTAPVRILTDDPVMEALFEVSLSPFFRRVDRGETLTVACFEGFVPCIDGPCVFVGKAPDDTKDGQVILSRPVDIDLLVSTCISLSESRTVTAKEGWSADLVGRVAAYGSSEVFLTKKEMELYLLLLSRIGECVTREELCQALWEDSGGNCADVYVCYLRKKLEKIAGPGVLISVRGKGYMLKKP